MLLRHIRSLDGLVETLIWSCASLFAALLSLILVHGTPFRISARVLSDAVAFEAVVVSVAIPVGLEVVGRLYDKYGSNQVKRFVTYELRLVPLILTVVGNVLLILVLNVIGPKAHPSMSLWAGFGSVAIALLFWRFLDRVVDFVVNEPDAVLERMARLANVGPGS